MTAELPAGHSVRVFMRVEGDPEVMVGSARTAEQVPDLLRAIADEWHRKVCVELDSGRYFATEDQGVELAGA